MDFDPTRHRPQVDAAVADADLFLDQLPPADAKGVPGNEPEEQVDGIDHGTSADAFSVPAEPEPEPVVVAEEEETK